MHGTYECLSLTTKLKRIGCKLCQFLQMLQRIDSSVYQLELCRFSGYARVCIWERDISDTIERCRAKLDSGRATVGRQNPRCSG